MNSPALTPDLLYALAASAVGIAVALLLHFVIFRILTRLATASEGKTDDIVVAHLRQPTRWALAALGVMLAAREVALLATWWQKVAAFVMPALIGWMALAILKAAIEAGALPTEASATDDVALRRRRTRLAIFGRIATFIILTVTIGLMLLSIPGVREIGVTLMASAGLAGLAVGAAAQPALKSLIAGLQMALTEPIRIDDMVTIDGESGRVEDIRATYVVLRLWDERRMIVPSARFLDSAFVTSTRTGSAVVGTVLLFVRPSADVAAIRAAFLTKLAGHAAWDKRKGAVQVTNSTVDTMELRLVMSARNAKAMNELRCDMREAMLAWLRDEQPGMTGPK